MKYYLLVVIMMLLCFKGIAQDKKLIKEAAFRYEITEPVYEWDTAKLVKRIGISGYTNVTYEVVTEGFYLKQPAFRYKVTPPIYEEQLITEIKPDGSSVSYIAQTLVKEATMMKVEIPGEMGFVSKEIMSDGILDFNAATIPQTYQFKPYLKLVQEATIKKTPIPAEYEK